MATPAGLWTPLPRSALPAARHRRDALLARLLKAGGHIKSCERRLWRDRRQGLWSAAQARARIAECWLWLEDTSLAPPPMERWLPQATLEERLEALARQPKPAPLTNALDALDAAEAAVRAQPFPPRPEGALDAAGRTALRAGLARKERLVDALAHCLALVEQAFAARYVQLGPGDWLRLPDGGPAQVVGWPGLRLELFLPAQAWPDPGRAYRCFLVHMARGITRLRRPPAAAALPPAYYWLCHAHGRAAAARRLLTAAPDGDPEAIPGTLLAAVDAAAKTWLARAPMPEQGLSWRVSSLRNVALLQARAPRDLAIPLLRLGRRAVRLRGEADAEQPDSPAAAPGWQLQAAVLLQALEPLLARLGERVWDSLAQGPPARLPLRKGQRVRVDGSGEGVMLCCDGRKLLYRPEGSGDPRAVRFGEVFIAPCQDP